MMDIWHAEVAINHNYILGEGAFWHKDLNRFIFVDILAGKVGAYDPSTGIVKEIEVGKNIGTVVPYKDTELLLVALQDELCTLDFETGQLDHLIHIEKEISTNRCNDGKLDAVGRFWVGTMELYGKNGCGSLYVFHNDTLEKKIADTSISNGICWSLDNKTMYYIDSPLCNVRAFDYDLEKGTISNERIIIEINEGKESVPDGMCIDKRGMLWIAIWGSGCVNRYNPRTGQLIGKVLVPASQVSSCAIGTINENTLFITSASVGLKQETLSQYDGNVFIVKNLVL